MENQKNSLFIKAIAVLMVIVMAFSYAPLISELGAESPFTITAEAVTKGIFTYTVKNKKATITEVDMEAKGEIKIPSKLGGYPVTAIGDFAFILNAGITSVIIPDSVEKIGYGVFSSCFSLKSVSIGKGLKTLDGNPFSGCESLKTITVSKDNQYFTVENGILFNKDKTKLILCPPSASIAVYTVPESVKTIGEAAFAYNSKINTVNIPAGVTKIEDQAFYYCVNLKNVTATENLYMVGTDAFGETPWYNSVKDDVVYLGSAACGYSGENVPKTITIKDGTKGIAASAFTTLTDAEEVYVPASVISIGSYAFIADLVKITVAAENQKYTSDADGVLYTKDMKTLIAYPANNPKDRYTVSDKTEVIGEGAFTAAKFVKELYLPDSVKKIEDSAFVFADALTKVRMSNNLTEIGETAFSFCISLESISIPDKVKTIKTGTFSWCTSLKSVKFGKNLTKICESAFSSCYELKKVNLTGKITTIEKYAFSDCLGLKTVVIGKNVKNIKGNPFTSCESLKKYTVEKGSKYFSVDGYGALLNKKGTKFISYPFGRKGTSYSVPKTVTAIGSDAFAYCKNLKTISLPEKLKTIGESAFNDCSGIKSINLHNTKTVGANAFAFCENLENVYFSEKLKTVGESAFDGCEDLSDIYYGGSKKQWKNIEFSEYNEAIKLADKQYNHKHSYNKGKTASKATYLRDGYKLYTCDKCECVMSKTIAKKKLAKADVKSVKSSKKKQFVVIWNKIDAASGYEIVYSTSKKFTEKTTKKLTVNKAETLKVTAKKLKSGKKYYVKVRAFKTVDGKKVYGAWSSVKSVKVK